jgi:cytochrome P450
MEAYRNGTHWYVNELHNQHGDVVKVSRDGHPVVFFRGSEDIRQVLLDEDNFGKTFDADDVSTSFLQYLMNIMQPLLREAEVFGSADNAKQRAVMRKTFMSAEEFLPGFAKAIDACLDRGKFWTEGVTEVSIASHILVFEAVMVIIMGNNTTYTRDFYDESTRVLRFYEQKYSQPMFDMKLNTEDDAVMGKLKEEGLKVVREFKRRLANGTQNRPGDSPLILERSMLVQLVRDGTMGDDEMCATMINTLLAASEGPAAGLTYTLAELAKNKLVQTTLHAEVAAAEDKPLSFNTLPYLTGTVLEGLRLFSPVTLVQRYALQDTVVAGYEIPKGTVCAVCIAAVHRDTNQFDQAEVFDPTRTGLDYQVLQRGGTFMTFSGGPRGCPGKHLAVCIMKQCFAKVRCAFSTESCTRGCHWFPRLLA